MKTSDPEEILKRLRSLYCLNDHSDDFLHFTNPYEILIATILSAQTTDKSVNIVTKELFKSYPSSDMLALADIEDVERIIHITGFFHAKAKNIVNSARILTEKYGGNVPEKLDDLLTLPGVGRKTALIVLNHAYGKTEGIAVDTHVKRLSMRLGLSEMNDPIGIEKDLLRIFNKDEWSEINGLFILHGRKVCTARNPHCDICLLNDLCEKRKMDRAGIEPAASTMPR